MRTKHREHRESSHHAQSKKKPERKKLGLFYKISFSILLLALLTLTYFVVLVSSKPKEIPFVTKKIETVLREKFGNDAGLGKSYVSFTRYGALKVTVVNLKIFYASSGGGEKQAFVIPKLESEFSLFNFLLLKFQPSKIKIINPKIVIDDLQKLQQGSADQSGHSSLIIELLSSIRKGESPIKNLEIENAKLLIIGKEFDTEILIKESKIQTAVRGKALQISSVNKINFDVERDDVDLNSSCLLSSLDGLKCDLSLVNFIPNSIADLHPKLSPLNQINATFNATTSFAIKDGEMGKVFFKAEAKKGDFEFPDFFAQKMDFRNFSAAGSYDNKAKILSLSDIKTDFEGEELAVENKSENKSLAPHLAMSLGISTLEKNQGEKLDFYIKISDVLNDDLGKFWPVALNEGGVRDWVLSHLKGGVVKNAYAKFSILNDGSKNHLSSLDSEVNFFDSNLGYSVDFPAITKISGLAKFTANDMKISIASGDVLSSKISDGLVAIDDFHAPKVILKISGKSQGHASDLLKHANYKSEFAKEVEKYLNGNSQNDFDVRISLSDEINLKNTYIAVNSAVSGLNNDYVKGGVIINAKKDFNSTDFITNVDFTAAELVAKSFDVEKKSNVESELDVTVSLLDPQKIHLKNILLKKTELVEKKGLKKAAEPNAVIGKISGDAEFNIANSLLSSVNLKNENFGKNNYFFSYKTNREKSIQKISIKGQRLNLASFIEGTFFKNSSSKQNFLNSQIQVAVNDLGFLRNKSIKNFSLSLSCRDRLCYKGLLKGNYGKKQSINLRVEQRPKKDFISIDGRITDIGYMAEALGISNVISAGDAEVKLRSKMVEKKLVLEGDVEIDDDVTIYESAAVKRFSKNNLFSQIKDKIFSSDKTTFNSVKLKFDVQGNILNVKSLIANNYKIGITAKGFFNLKEGTHEISGMIIPGFLINNLFGIGNLPIFGKLLTGEKGGGLFGIRYTYIKKKGDKEAVFETNKVAAFVPSTLQHLFD